MAQPAPVPGSASPAADPEHWLDPERVAALGHLPVGALFPPGFRLSPRDRLMIAMAESVREHGFRGASVADVVRRARTSRRTFYEYFPDREECFLRLFDLSNAIFAARIAAALDPTKPWREQVREAVDVYIAVVTSEPQITIAFTRELGSLGDRGRQRQADEVRSFAEFLVRLVSMVGERDPAVRPISFETALVVTCGLRESAAYCLEQDRDLAPFAEATVALITTAIESASAVG